MRNRILSVLLMPALFPALLMPGVAVAGAVIQSDPLRVDKPRPIVRKPKGHKKPYVEKAPLLRIEWRVLKRDERERPKETSTNAIFHDGDRLQLRIRPNQNGYLHIFQHREGDPNGAQVFPDSRINQGNNFVMKYQEIVIPSGCAKPYVDDNGNCWFKVSDPPGRQVYTVIFSRDAFTEALTGIDVIGGEAKTRDLLRIKETPRKITSQIRLGPEDAASGRYAITVQNSDSRNNEELIVKIAINHSERSNDQ